VKIRPRPGAAPTQLWPLHPANVLTYRQRRRRADLPLPVRASRGQVPGVGLEDIVHFKTYNPDDQVRGLSRLEPLRQTILNEDSARRAAAAMWSNGGRPSFVVTTPKGLTDTALKRLAQVKGLHQGVDNWGKIAILEEGLTPHVLPVTPSRCSSSRPGRSPARRRAACTTCPRRPSTSSTTRRSRTSPSRCGRCTGTRWLRGWGCSSRASMPSCARTSTRRATDVRGVPAGRGAAWCVRAAGGGEPVGDLLGPAHPERGPQAGQPAAARGRRPALHQRGCDPAGDLGPDAGDQRADRPPKNELGPLLAEVDACTACGNAGNLSARGLCRSCEGKAGRMLATVGADDA
jgi:hypothetical protein